MEGLITPRTTGILGVHLWGQPCDLDGLAEIAARHGLALLFDAAHALGSSYRGRPVGNFGDMEVFSFHATKFVNTAEGGAVTTNDDALAARLRVIRDFGFDPNDCIVDVGTNGKMSEICAAMGLTYLESFQELLAANRATYAQYRTELAGMQGVSLLALDGDDARNCQYVVLTIDESAAGLSRDELLLTLQADNVFAKRYFYPGCHKMVPPGTTHPSVQLPVTESLVRAVLVLPGGASIEPHEIHGVCEILRSAVNQRAKIREVVANRLYSKTIQPI